jgi:hypothetical protein
MPKPSVARVAAVRASVALAIGIALVACSDSPPKPRTFTPDHPAEVHHEAPPPHVAPPKRHATHEHPHGPHPHPASDHHHHPHPHPHLDGPDGHHHPY